jgi:hypothetical protein
MDLIEGLIKTIHQNTNYNDLHDINSAQCKAAIQKYLEKSGVVKESKKIDITSLDAATKKKIKNIKERCLALYEGASKEIEIPTKIKFTAYWMEGVECDVDIDEPYYNSKPLIATQNKYRKEINNEIKEIIKFSDSIAKKLGVDKTEFWNFLNYEAKHFPKHKVVNERPS